MKLSSREIIAWIALAAAAGAVAWLVRDATSRDRYVGALELELVAARRQGEDAAASRSALEACDAARGPRTRALLALTSPGTTAEGASGDAGSALLIDAPDASDLVVVVQPSSGSIPTWSAETRDGDGAAFRAAGDGLFVASISRDSLQGDGGARVAPLASDGDGGAIVRVARDASRR